MRRSDAVVLSVTAAVFVVVGSIAAFVLLLDPSAMVLPSGVAIVKFGGLREPPKTAQQKSDEQRIKTSGQRIALQQLRKHGIVGISDDTIVDAGEPGEIHVRGTGKSASGKLHKFTVVFAAAKFGNVTQWEHRGTILDDNVVEKSN